MYIACRHQIFGHQISIVGLHQITFGQALSKQNQVMNVPDSHEVSYLVIVRIISKFNTLLRVMTYRLTIFTVTACSHWLVLAMLATNATRIKPEPEVFRDGLAHNLFPNVRNQ